MVIRSQDKTKLFHFDNGNIKIDTILNGPSVIQGHNYAGWLNLGEYKSEEQAIEVLSDITQCYGAGHKVYQMPPKEVIE